MHDKDLEDDFNYKSSSKDKRQPYCRECSHEDWHERYGKEERRIRNKNQRERVRETIKQYLIHKYCALCGAKEDLVLQPRSLVSNFISRKYSSIRIREILLDTETTVLCNSCFKETAE